MSFFRRRDTTPARLRPAVENSDLIMLLLIRRAFAAGATEIVLPASAEDLMAELRELHDFERLTITHDVDAGTHTWARSERVK